jgi:hypothetical protein
MRPALAPMKLTSRLPTFSLAQTDLGPSRAVPPHPPPIKAGSIAGYVFETSDIGYSGKPIRLLVGLDTNGVITGAKVIEHHEPILLVGIPQEKLFAFVEHYVGRSIIDMVGKGAMTAFHEARLPSPSRAASLVLWRWAALDSPYPKAAPSPCSRTSPSSRSTGRSFSEMA